MFYRPQNFCTCDIMDLLTNNDSIGMCSTLLSSKLNLVSELQNKEGNDLYMPDLKSDYNWEKTINKEDAIKDTKEPTYIFDNTQFLSSTTTRRPNTPPNMKFDETEVTTTPTPFVYYQFETNAEYHDDVGLGESAGEITRKPPITTRKPDVIFNNN
jgi:hypothetical protein